MLSSNSLFVLSLVAGVVALAYGTVLARWVLRKPTGDDKMREIAAAIQEGAQAYLARQYRTVAVVAVVLAVSYFLFSKSQYRSWFLAWRNRFGPGWLRRHERGSTIKRRTAEAAKSGLSPAFDLGFKGGAVTGLFVVGLGFWPYRHFL
jgi:K(+)-stimulated pyrophosphate-energized sodium pump